MMFIGNALDRAPFSWYIHKLYIFAAYSIYLLSSHAKVCDTIRAQRQRFGKTLSFVVVFVLCASLESLGELCVGEGVHGSN